jgi:hypothetical protein
MAAHQCGVAPGESRRGRVDLAVCRGFMVGLCVAMLPGCVIVRGTTGHTMPKLHVTGQVVDESNQPLSGLALTYAPPKSALFFEATVRAVIEKADWLGERGGGRTVTGDDGAFAFDLPERVLLGEFERRLPLMRIKEFPPYNCLLLSMDS